MSRLEIDPVGEDGFDRRIQRCRKRTGGRRAGLTQPPFEILDSRISNLCVEACIFCRQAFAEGGELMARQDCGIPKRSKMVRIWWL